METEKKCVIKMLLVTIGDGKIKVCSEHA